MKTIDGLTPSEAAALQTFRQKLAQGLRNNVVTVKLYGSKARGDAHPGSDVDLVVVVPRLNAQVEDLVWNLELEMLDRYGVVMETLTLSQQDYETSLAQQWPFMLNLEQEGISL